MVTADRLAAFRHQPDSPTRAPSLRLPENESNVIVEVHYYDPGKFTHQQAAWSSNRIYKDIHWTGSDGG
jgi:hypothetical protein